MHVYLDWNATAPPLPAVIDAMADVARNAWGNPSSVHFHGRAARAIVEDARAAVAELAGVDPRDVVFTGSATESNNLAIVSALSSKQGRLLTSKLEHPSVTRIAERFETRWLRVLPTGVLDLEDLERAVSEGPVGAIAVQAVNQETGVIQPLAEVFAIAAGAWVHVDAAQSWGKVSMDTSLARSRSVAPHKFRGPKGIGALVLAPGAKVAPVLVGGSQEKGIRPGTVDPSLAAGVGVAARHARTGPERYEALARLRDQLERALVEMGGVVNSSAPRAPHVTSVSFAGWRGPELVAALDLEGVSCSGGSACSAGTAEPSPVLMAMHGAERASSSIRVSMGETTSEKDVEAAIAAFRTVSRRR